MLWSSLVSIIFQNEATLMPEHLSSSPAISPVGSASCGLNLSTVGEITISTTISSARSVSWTRWLSAASTFLLSLAIRLCQSKSNRVVRRRSGAPYRVSKGPKLASSSPRPPQNKSFSGVWSKRASKKFELMGRRYGANGWFVTGMSRSRVSLKDSDSDSVRSCVGARRTRF
jgi:hypothetical protein